MVAAMFSKLSRCSQCVGIPVIVEWSVGKINKTSENVFQVVGSLSTKAPMMDALVLRR